MNPAFYNHRGLSRPPQVLCRRLHFLVGFVGMPRYHLLRPTAKGRSSLQCTFKKASLLKLRHYSQDRILEPGKLLEEIPNWFPGARLNYAENLLIRKDDGIALTEATELGVIAEVSYKELNARVGQMAAALRANGLKVGDRVAGKPMPSSSYCVGSN